MLVCLGMRKRIPNGTKKCIYSEKDRTVYLHGSPIITVLKHMDEGGWELSINLCGWGDTRTTRSFINSILTRLNLPYRVGQHKRKRYMYIIDAATGGLTPLFEMPHTGGVTIPTGASPFLTQEV